MTPVNHALDARLMAACLRMARRNTGLTASNPSVGTLLVQTVSGAPIIVGRGVTALGGRPHAERLAIEQAGDQAKGATAYVTLEPCAHHGATPPCAEALIAAGVSRVVTAWVDPDDRVDGKGHAMLRNAGIAVATGVCSQGAAKDLLAYLTRKEKARPAVTLKLAISADGYLGRIGEEITITNGLCRGIVHRLRAEHDAILVGHGTLLADDPALTVRLPGLERRSPHRFVLAGKGHMPTERRIFQSIKDAPTTIITDDVQTSRIFEGLGVKSLMAERVTVDGRSDFALPEILEDMAALGISSVLVEGGATVAQSFLSAGLVDRVELFTSCQHLSKGQGGAPIPSPLSQDWMIGPGGEVFEHNRTLHLEGDRLDTYLRAFPKG